MHPTAAVYASVPQSQWQWFVILLVFTLLPAIAFVAIELFRDTNADGSTQEKTKVENVVEGVIFLLLVLAWIPTVGAVTTPNGAASMVGNSYFFSTFADRMSRLLHVLLSLTVSTSICFMTIISLALGGFPL
jgi:hypothetical protein